MKASLLTIDGAGIVNLKGAQLSLNGGGCPVARGNNPVIIPTTAPAGAQSNGSVLPVASTVLVPC
jgi:hypothetical protein